MRRNLKHRKRKSARERLASRQPNSTILRRLKTGTGMNMVPLLKQSAARPWTKCGARMDMATLSVAKLTTPKVLAEASNGMEAFQTMTWTTFRRKR